MAAKKQPTKALALYDEELAQLAQEAADQEANTGGGQFFSTRGGILAFAGAPIPNNEMVVIVLDSILVNAFYPGDFDPDAPQSPTCYAFGRNDKTMKPHADSEEPVSEECEGCPNNEFGSASKGRGKACKNGRRIALLPAGNIDRNGEFEAYEDEGEFAKGQVGFLNLAPTSINSYGAYVKQINAALKKPPLSVFTKVSLVPDPKAQFKVVFENLGPVSEDLVPVLLARFREVRPALEFPFPKAEAREEAPRRGATTRGAKQAPTRAPARKDLRRKANY